jgi:hypothetical protein
MNALGVKLNKESGIIGFAIDTAIIYKALSAV